MREIVSPLDGIRSPFRTARGRFSPLALFAASEPGGWYDPSDLTTLFQDAAGTTPVTAVEQPVGLVLDKSKGLVLGSELVTNGDFSNGTTGWESGSGNTTLTVVDGEARCEIVGYTQSMLYRSVAIATSNVLYKVEFDVYSPTFSGSVRFSLNDSSASDGFSFTAPVTTTKTRITSYLRAGTTPKLWITATTAPAIGTVLYFDNISVKQVQGNHLSQSTSTARPVLRATSRIDYDGTDDKMTAASSGGGTTGFLFVAGINLDAIGATQTIWSDTGTNTGYRVRINSSNQLELAAGNGTAYTTAVTTETLSATTNHVIAAWHDGTNLNVKLGTGGAVASQAFAAASAGSAGFTIGMDNGSVSSQLNGKLYNVVYVKNFAGSLSDVTNTIAYVNGTLT